MAEKVQTTIMEISKICPQRDGSFEDINFHMCPQRDGSFEDDLFSH